MSEEIENIVPVINIPDIEYIQPIESDNSIVNTVYSPTIKESTTDSARIFHVDPGYIQGDKYMEEGGLYITNIKVNNNTDNITFDLYNTKDATGFVEFYDDNGKLIGVERINPHANVINGFESWWNGLKNTADAISKYGFNGIPITHPMNSEHLAITAPKGTRNIVVTNNVNASAYAKAYDLVDSIFRNAEMFKSLIDAIKSFGEFKEDLAANGLADNVKKSMVERVVNKLQENVAEMVLENELSETNIMYNTLNSVLKDIGDESLKEWAIGELDMQKIFEESLEYAITNTEKIATDAIKNTATEICKGLLKGNPAVFGLETINFTGGLLDSWSKSITKGQLKDAKPMILEF